MLSAGLDSHDEKGSSNRLGTQDVLLSKGASPKGLHIAQQAITIRSSMTQYPRGSLGCQDGGGAPSPLLESCYGGQKCDSSLPDNDISKSGKEEERRKKLRERKRVQRLNQDFAERERLRARGRIKALRQDPVFRQNERQRDKERRRKARLVNQNQRLHEKERDKLHKSLIRSLMADGNGEVNSGSMVNGASVNPNNLNRTASSTTSVNTLTSCATKS